MSKLLKNRRAVVGVCQVFGIILLLSLFFNVSDVLAYSAAMTIDSSVSIDVSSSGKGVSIEEGTVNVRTDCRKGYNLTIATPNGSNLYKNGNTSNPASITAVDGTSALNSSNNTNKWGYSLATSATESLVFDPLSSTPTFIRTASGIPSDVNINETFRIYYGVNVDNTVAPGTYQMANNGAVVYYLTMHEDCKNYTVDFNANGGTGTMDDQDVDVGSAIRLKGNTFTAPALGSSYQDADGNTITGMAGKMWAFWGWNTEVDGTGDWYKDREAVNDLADNGETITLYAQWKQATLADLTITPSGTNKTINHNTMQDMSTAACYNSDRYANNSTPYGQITLVDSRDGIDRTYTVARLTDGYCWMTQNLNLGTSTAITLTSDDTNLAEGTTFTLPASNSSDFSTSSSISNYNTARVLNNMTVPDYTINNITYSGKINAYYSYAAATADTNTSSKTSMSEVYTSICPKNWNLPTSSRYFDLRAKGGISSAGVAVSEPYYFTYGGYRKAAGNTVNTTSFTNPTTGGYYWMGNINSGSSALAAYINSGGINTSSVSGVYGNTLTKYYGLSVRCVADMNDADYRITFVNTVTGEKQTQVVGLVGDNDTASITLLARWLRSGYGLSGWDTNSAGTNIVYTNGQSITLTGDITLYSVWKPVYTIQYNGNGADAGSMANVRHTNTYENDVFDLFASNYSKVNYGFAGWSFDPNAQPGGSSRIYGPNEAITAPAGTANETKMLYAVWVANSGNIQGWSGCSSMNKGDVIALKDTRDNNVYAVGKLADNNCWMMENLRLDTAGSSDSTKSQGFGGVFAGLANSEGNILADTTANSLYYSGTSDGIATIDIGTANNPNYRFPRFNSSTTTNRASDPVLTDDRYNQYTAHGKSLSADVYSYGNYYTWSAAKASTESLGSYSSSEASRTSICPAGWKMPYGRSSGNGNTSGGFYYLGVQLGATSSNETSSRIWRSYPNNFIIAGYKTGTTSYNVGTTAFYYSATQTSSGSPYMLSFKYDTMSAGSTMSAGTSGRSVRCLVETGLEVRLMWNDGTGRVSGRVYGNANSSVSLPSLSRGGYTFAGWNTAADGSGTSVSSSYSLGNTGITLYAQWDAI